MPVPTALSTRPPVDEPQFGTGCRTPLTPRRRLLGTTFVAARSRGDLVNSVEHANIGAVHARTSEALGAAIPYVGTYKLAPTTPTRTYAQAKNSKRFRAAYGTHCSSAEAPHHISNTRSPAPSADQRHYAELRIAVTSVSGKRGGVFFHRSPVLTHLPPMRRHRMSSVPRIPMRGDSNSFLRHPCAKVHAQSIAFTPDPLAGTVIIELKHNVRTPTMLSSTAHNQHISGCRILHVQVLTITTVRCSSLALRTRHCTRRGKTQ